MVLGSRHFGPLVSRPWAQPIIYSGLWLWPTIHPRGNAGSYWGEAAATVMEQQNEVEDLEYYVEDGVEEGEGGDRVEGSGGGDGAEGGRGGKGEGRE